MAGAPVRAGCPHAGHGPAAGLAADPAVAALRMRYAKGEVSRQDFRHALADLTGADADRAGWPGVPTGEDVALSV